MGHALTGRKEDAANLHAVISRATLSTKWDIYAMLQTLKRQNNINA